MKSMVILLCCLALGQAADVTSSSRSAQNQPEELKTEKRALAEGNAAVQKRAPINVSPTPGIEYADSKQAQVADKSPSQQIYATPAPQLAKISDVLTGQGITFPTAIASHLFSPVSVYQSRLGSPTTYEVSQPVPSQLAYSEHKVYQPAQQNSVQYYGAQQRQSKSDQLARLVYNQPAPPQLFFQPQQVLYSQQQSQSPQPQLYPQQHLVQQSQQVYTQQQSQAPQPQAIFQYQFPAPTPVYNQVQQQQPLSYSPTQGPVTFTQNQVQQPFGYNQASDQAQLIQLLPPQPIQYARQQQVPLNYQQQLQNYYQNQAPQTFQQQPQVPQHHQQQPQAPQNYQLPQQVPLNIQVQQQHYQAQQHQVPVQRELKNVQAPAKVLEKQTQAPQPNFNDKQTGAVSYASFSQSQPSPNLIPIQYQPSNQPKDNNKPQQQQIIYVKNQIAPQNYQQQLPVHQLPAQQLPAHQLPAHQLPTHQLPVPQYQQQPYSQGQGVLVQSQGFQGGYAPQPIPVAPTFAPLQYFGKFAQSIFGYPQQQQ